jgi:hypothetical protein
MNESPKRKNKGPNFNVYVGTTFRDEVFCEIEALAASHKLASAQVVRELFLRGLAAYGRDDRLTESAADSGLAVTPYMEEAPVEIAA